MKERPILLSGPMVRAILEGRKTQTRRVMRPQPACGCIYEINGNHDKAVHWNGDRDNPLYVPPTPRSKDHLLPCPYGQPGDRLWVRETFKAFQAGFPKIEDGWCVNYRADENGLDGPWKPSIHMPRKFCRLLLDVKAIRVERLQDITYGDKAAEGCPAGYLGERWMVEQWFYELWNSLNEKRGFGWNANPWVWVIEFERASDQRKPAITKGLDK